jgi:hypothetical protein
MTIEERRALIEENAKANDKATTGFVIKHCIYLLSICLCGMYFTFQRNNIALLCLPFVFAALLASAWRTMERSQKHNQEQYNKQVGKQVGNHG